MAWETHNAKEYYPQFAREWDRLNFVLFGQHPFYDSRFIGPLLKHFGDGSELLCINRQNGEAVGALILKSQGYGRWSTFRPSQAQITAVLLDDLKEISGLFHKLPGLVWTIELIAVDPHYGPSLDSISHTAEISDQAYTIGIDGNLVFDSYWNQHSKNLRSNIRRYGNRISDECSELKHVRISQVEDIEPAVHRFGHVESAGWKGKAGTAIAPDNIQGAFYAEVMRLFAADGAASAYELHIDGTLAASRLMIENQQMSIILKTTYDESLAQFAPGRMQLREVIRDRLVNHVGQTIELYTNATRDQREWATSGRMVLNVQLFAKPSWANVFAMLKSLRNALANAGCAMELPTGGGIQSHSSISAIRQLWVDAKNLAAPPPLETRPDWFELLHQTVFANEAGVRYYAIAAETVILAMLPVVHRGRNVKVVEALSNFYTPLYAPQKTEESDLNSFKFLLAHAAQVNGGAHLMRFAPMDPSSSVFHELYRHLLTLGWTPFRFFCFGNWYLKVERDWEHYLKHRSANLRSRIKRKTRSFLEAGGTLEIITDDSQTDRAITAFQEVYSASWKIPEPYPEFIPALIRLIAATGEMRLGIAWLAEKPIAAQLWIVTGDKASIYKVAYHEAYASYSPGTVLTARMLQHAIDRDRVKEVDFLIGDDDYKKEWMSHRRERWGIVAYNARTLPGVAMLLRELAGRFTKEGRRKISALIDKARRSHRNNNQTKSPTRTKKQHHNNMTWEILPANRLSEYATQWDTLVHSQPGTPFLESAFLLPALEVFGNGSEKLCLIRENGRLRGGAIMQRRPKGIWQTFQPSQLPLGAWVTDSTVEFTEICDALARRLPGISLGIGVSQVDSRVQRRPADGPKVRSQDYIQTAWVDIDRDFDAYWEERGKNLKQNMRKQRNKLASEGIETRMELITAPDDVAKAVSDYGLLESTGWKSTDGTAIHADNDQGRFYCKMLENFCKLGRGRIYRYWFGEKIVAMDLCIQDQDAIVILKTAYDESYKTVSPATLMRQEQFKQLFDEKRVARIEFFGKVMEWHTRWTQQSRSLYHVTTYRWPWLRQLHKRLSAPASSQTQQQVPTA